MQDDEKGKDREKEENGLLDEMRKIVRERRERRERREKRRQVNKSEESPHTSASRCFLLSCTGAGWRSGRRQAGGGRQEACMLSDDTAMATGQDAVA